MEGQVPAAGGSSNRSAFVTVTAWVVIVFAVLAIAGSLIQVVIVELVVSSGQLGPEMSGGPFEAIAGLGNLMLAGVRVLSLGLLTVSVLTLVMAVGLLRRRNWARVLFILFLVAGIAQNALGMAANYFMLSLAPGDAVLTGTPLDAMMPVMWVVTVVTGVGLIVLFAWMIRKLTSEPIRDEFRGASSRPPGPGTTPGGLLSSPGPGETGRAGPQGGLGW